MGRNFYFVDDSIYVSIGKMKFDNVKGKDMIDCEFICRKVFLNKTATLSKYYIGYGKKRSLLIYGELS